MFGVELDENVIVVNSKGLGRKWYGLILKTGDHSLGENLRKNVISEEVKAWRFAEAGECDVTELSWAVEMERCQIMLVRKISEILTEHS
jgi:hypothetical protein